MEDPAKVKVIIVISGKRKCGKDFLADNIVNNLGDEHCVIVRLSSPIKQHFCAKYNMNLSEMLSSSEYKEIIRREMILWGEKQRNKDPGVFCKTITKDAMLSGKVVWIVSDARRVSDVEFFQSYAIQNNVKCYCIRISADKSTRIQRNWKFTCGVDDATSECGLDDFGHWDFMFSNSMNNNLLLDIQDLCCNVKEIIVGRKI